MLDTPQFIKTPCHVSPFILARSDNQGQDKLSGFFRVFVRGFSPHLVWEESLVGRKCRAQLKSIQPRKKCSVIERVARDLMLGHALQSAPYLESEVTLTKRFRPCREKKSSENQRK